jgi:alkyl sulfatase BDS1-like metallo-beta-lactamase superfamily hydrolase
MGTAPKPASEHTHAANAPIEFDFDPMDVDRARRGLIAQHTTGAIETSYGVVWDVNRYSFIEPGSEAPDTVHPSLWRQAQLNGIHGLFEVDEGVWQCRGYDISNVTFIAGTTGWIVVDPLTAAPCAAACLELVNAHVGVRPVVAVIYTHSHTDHFGGVLGVTTREDVAEGRCRVIAPEHFMRETVGENVIAGYAMVRRAMYQFGPLLPAGPRQHVDCGLGRAIPMWPADLIAPTEEITATGQELVVDGVRIVFQLAPESEAPAEMQFFFPDMPGHERGWLCTAENCTHTMHNLVPIRGALVRDSLKWSKYIDQMIDMWGDQVRLCFASHHWPRWGNDDVLSYLATQRDLYRWLHDQTMRQANHGLTAVEIAETLTLPPEFAAHAHTTGYYGQLAHNVKAVYQRYLSWYDGNPANLWKLPPTEAGQRYVDVAGGPGALLDAARRYADAGDYRFAAELVNHLVFAQPDHVEARELQADVLEQLGYQSESATFRNAYLTGAQELRNGTLPRRPATKNGLMAAMNAEQIFDAMAVRLRAESVGGRSVELDLRIADADVAGGSQRWLLRLSNRAMSAIRSDRAVDANATLLLDRTTLYQLTEAQLDLASAVADGRATVDGDIAAAEVIFSSLDTFMTQFPIVEP